jgi:hypothetical protein
MAECEACKGFGARLGVDEDKGMCEKCAGIGTIDDATVKPKKVKLIDNKTEEIVIEKGKVVKRPREQLNGYAAAYRKRQSVIKAKSLLKKKRLPVVHSTEWAGPRGAGGARSIRFLIRWSSDEEALIRTRAHRLGLSVADLLRRSAMGEVFK